MGYGVFPNQANLNGHLQVITCAATLRVVLTGLCLLKIIDGNATIAGYKWRPITGTLQVKEHNHR